MEKAIHRGDPDWKKQDDRSITYKDRIYVPCDKTLCGNIISHHHDTPLAGHDGCFKTVGNILRDYWWPTIQHDVRIYVEGCETCQ